MNSKITFFSIFKEFLNTEETKDKSSKNMPTSNVEDLLVTQKPPTVILPTDHPDI